MKLKLRYFIRGLGIGIVFTAIVMSLSLQAARSRIIRENALTKEEIMEKAMGYGMILDSTEDTTPIEQNESSQVKQDEEENQNSDNQNEDESKDVDVQQKDDDEQQEENKNAESDKEEVDSSEDSQEDEEEVKQETKDSDSDSDKDTDISEGDTEESSNKEESIVSIDYIPIKITSGMTATDVGKLLKEKKVIEDVDEFRSYMSEQGYSSKILIGNYLIPVNATYKKIANIITKKQ